MSDFEGAGAGAELLLEAAGEVAQRGESCHVGYFREGILVLLDELGGAVELVGLEEDRGG